MDNNFNIPVEKLNEPGNMWIRPQNKQLRYSTDANESPSWINPLPVYKASKEIKFGQPISLTDYSQEHSISSGGARERTIMPTDSLSNSSFIGIAIEYGIKNNFIHAQNNGEIVYELKNKNNSKYWLPPYHTDSNNNTVFDWTDSDVGSTVYITSNGSYTLNVDEVSGGNIMSVGKLVFAPKSTEIRENQQKIIIHIQAGGDDRGVKDTSQFTVQMVPVISPSSVESNYDCLFFVKINRDGLGEIIFNDESVTSDIESSPVGAILIKSSNGVCNLSSIQNKKITLTRMGLVSGNFGFSTSNVGKIGLLSNGSVAFKAAKDYEIKVGIFKSYSGEVQDFLIDCRYPVETQQTGDKIGTIKPVFGSNEQPLLDIGYALIDESIHRVNYVQNDNIDTSGIDWSDLVRSCYSKDIFEFGRKINGEFIFSRVLEDFNGKSWSPDIYDSSTTVAIFSPDTFFRFRNLYYTVGNFADNNIRQVACQIKFTTDATNTDEDCIWPEETYKLKIKALSDENDYVLGGKGQDSTLFCNITRLVAIGNYMDRDGSNIETYDISVKIKSTGQILSPGFYQNADGKWCGYEWCLYENNGITYLYMSTIPAGKEAEDCNGLCIITAGDKLKTTDPEETLLVTVRRRPTQYNAVYLNQYPVDNPWTPYIDGNTGNLITENAIYFGSPSKLFSPNQTSDEEGTSGLEFNESGRNGKIELTTEDSRKIINLTTQIRGSTNTPIFRDKKQVIKNDGTIGNTIEWEYNFSDMVTELNSYFAPILISRKSSMNDVNPQNLNYIKNNVSKNTSDFNEYLNGKGVSAIEILDTYYFRHIKYAGDSAQTKPTISILTTDAASENKYIFEEKGNDLEGNKYSIDGNTLNEYKNFLYVNSHINYMSLLSLIGLSSKDLYNKILKLERIIHGADFNKYVETDINYESDMDYINNIGLLRTSGYLKKSLILAESSGIPALDLAKAYLPNSNYFSIVDRFVIENFYNYYSLEDLETKYEDYSDKNFNERFNLIKETTDDRGSNLAQLVITKNDLNISNYCYNVYDFFKYINDYNEYELSETKTHEGSFIEADKIIFVKNTKGYKSVCSDSVGYTYTNLKTGTPSTKTIYEISSDDFDPNQRYFINNGKRDYIETTLNEASYRKNKYYIQKTVESKYYGYPFMWPLYNDQSFNEIDFEYNFFAKKTYGLDDSASIYDDNESGILSSFSSQSLEGITFDTISKLSFLYSCFDKNHTFSSKMTWLLPFIVDDYEADYTYEIKRLSQTKSIDAEDGKIYSAFLTRDNKITELGSIYFDVFKHIFYESNFNEDVADSLSDYNNKYYDYSRGEAAETWKTRIIKERQTKNGLKDGHNISIKIDLGGKDIYTYSLPDSEEIYKKFIFLMTQGRLKLLKNLLTTDPYKAYKLYGDFFLKEYILSIDISTEEGVTKAINSIDKYTHLSLTDDQLKLLSKFSITPSMVGPVNDYKQIGSYGTIVSEIKSLRVVEDITLSEIQEFFDLLQSYDPPEGGSRDNINGNNTYTKLKRIKNDLNNYDGYKTSTLVGNITFTEENISTSTKQCPDGRQVVYQKCRQTGEFTTQNNFTIYKVSFISNEYEVPVSGCSTCVATAESIRNHYKDLVLLPNGLPNLNDESIGLFMVEVEPTALATSEMRQIQQNLLASAIVAYAYSSIGSEEDEIIDWENPDLYNQTIFLARCKYLLGLNYPIPDILAYYYNDDSTNEEAAIINWDDYELIDYARAAAYGSRNIVFYNIKAYKAFNNLPEEVDLSSYSPKDVIKNGIADTRSLVNNFDNCGLKVVWPTEINTNGQMQESLTYAKNDINKYINRTVSDESGTGNFGFINIKTNPVSRISILDVDNLPDITVGEFKLLLNGDSTIGTRCGLDYNAIKEYELNLDDLLVATNNMQIPVVNLTSNVDKTLYELRTLQYNQIAAHNNDAANAATVLSTPVCSTSKLAIIYDLIDQGLVFNDAEFFARSILASGENITGGFTRHPELETTYGLMNEAYFGYTEELNGFFYDNRLGGLSLHVSILSEKDVNQFKLKEIYNYNNIDRMLLALDAPMYEKLLKNISIIKNYIELFFDHSDKVLKDLSRIERKKPIFIDGTTYIDNHTDFAKVDERIESFRSSISNVDILKTLPEANTYGTDSYSTSFNSIMTTYKSIITANINAINSASSIIKANTDAINSATNTIKANKDTIDSAIGSIKANKNAISSATSSIKANKDAINSAANVIKANANAISSAADTIKANKAAISSAVNTIKADKDALDSIKTVLSNNKTAISSAQSVINKNTSAISNAKNCLTKIYNSFVAIKTYLEGLLEEGESLPEFSLNEINSAISTVTSSLNEVTTSNNELTTNISAITFDNLEEKLTAITNSTTTLESKVTEASNAITTLDTKLNAISTTDLDAKLTAIDTSLTDLDSKNTLVDNSITSLDTKFAAIASVLTDLDNKLTAITTATNDLDTKLGLQTFDTTTLDENISNFETELKKTMNDCIKKLITDTILKTPTIREFDSVKSDKTAFNIEKYDSQYDRIENFTGHQSTPYIYMEVIPEFSYLYTKPADGLSIRKEIESYEVNGGIYHNNLKTTVEHRRLIGNPLQNKMFIGDKIEIKEGAYLRGEQLPLPLVSLDIKPDTQLQSQRMSYKPIYTDYHCDPGIIKNYGSASLRSVYINGVFPKIEINGKRFVISTIKKNIISGQAFDELPNGLKIIPTLDLAFSVTYTNPSYYDEENNLVGGESSSAVFTFTYEGLKIYRNALYSLEITEEENQSALPRMLNGNRIFTTTSNGILNDHEVVTSDVIYSLPNVASETTKTRKLTIDEDFMRDIIMNSDIFVTNENISASNLTVTFDAGETSNPKEAIKPEVNNMNIKHISEVEFNLIYS
ncbi:MAG: hypothetical protein IKK93_00285 [Campylobacter sp.]|nr:hypothetical protein [Campylobacter sp.]